MQHKGLELPALVHYGMDRRLFCHLSTFLDHQKFWINDMERPMTTSTYSYNCKLRAAPNGLRICVPSVRLRSFHPSAACMLSYDDAFDDSLRPGRCCLPRCKMISREVLRWDTAGVLQNPQFANEASTSPSGCGYDDHGSAISSNCAFSCLQWSVTGNI